MAKRTAKQRASAGAEGGKGGGAAPPKPKKARDAVPGLLTTPLLTDEAALRAARDAYAKAKPYAHTSFEGLCDPAHLAAAREEVVQHMRATFKETDLFKLLQVPQDLACLEQTAPDVARRCPHLLALRDAIYSEPFRRMVRELTGCGPLSTKTDCSVNVYTKGSHLLCHDDVIGTRRLSYIIYLTDPEARWTEADGGALELFPLGKGGGGKGGGAPAQPAPVPTCRVLPHWNSMAIFEVVPGVSFHAVQEVLTARPRMSIQGWFHRPAEEEVPAHFASLAQLKGSASDAAAPAPFVPLPPCVPPADAEPSSALERADAHELARWINPTYLQPESIAQIQRQFCKASSMQLRGFLRDDVAARITGLARATDRADGVLGVAAPSETLAGALCKRHELGVGRAGWRLIGPPHMQRYMRYDAGEAGAPAREPSVGAALDELHTALGRSGAFVRYLRTLTNLSVVGSRAVVRRFRPGLDYTVAHAASMPPPSSAFLDATLCFVDEGDDGPASGGGGARSGGKKPKGARKARAPAPPTLERELWHSGDVGGFEAYLGAEEDDDPEVTAVYKTGDGKGGDEDDEGDLLNVEASSNTLNLVMRDAGTLRFVKYVSARAPGSRWDVAMEFEIDPKDLEHGDEEEGEDEDDSSEEGESEEEEDDDEDEDD